MKDKKGNLLIIKLKDSFIENIKELENEEDKEKFIINNLFKDSSSSIYDKVTLETISFNNINFDISYNTKNSIIKFDDSIFYTHSVKPKVFRVKCNKKEILTNVLFNKMKPMTSNEVIQDCIEMSLYNDSKNYVLITGVNIPNQSLYLDFLLTRDLNKSLINTKLFNENLNKYRFGILIKIN